MIFTMECVECGKKKKIGVSGGTLSSGKEMSLRGCHPMPNGTMKCDNCARTKRKITTAE